MANIGTLTGEIVLEDLATRTLEHVNRLLVDIGNTAQQTAAKIDSSFQTFGSRITSVGKLLSVGVTAPLVAFGTASAAAAMDVSAAMNQIITRTGATGEELEKLKHSFKVVFADVPDSADSVSRVMSDLRVRLGASGADLEDLTKKASAFAQVNRTDMVGAMNQVTTVINALDLNMDGMENTIANTSKVMDKLTLASQMSGASVNDLAHGVVAGGMAFTEMGYGLDESLALFVNFAKVGANVTDVTSSIGMAMQHLVESGVTDLKAGFKELLTSIREAPTDVEAFALSIEAFGGKAGKKLYEEIRYGTYQIDAQAEAIRNVGDIVGTAAARTETFTEKVAKLRHQVELALAPIGDRLVNAFNDLTPLMTRSAEALTSLIEKFSSLPPGVQDTVVAVGALLALLGPVAVGVGTMVSALGKIGVMAGIASLITGVTTQLGLLLSLTLSGGWAGFSLVVGSWGSALLALATGPVGIAVAAIAGIIAVTVLLIKHWDTVKSTATVVWDWVTEKTLWAFSLASRAVEYFRDSAIGQLIINLGQLQMKIAGWGFVAAGIVVWEGVKLAVDFARGAWQIFIEYAMPVIKGFWDLVKKVAETIQTAWSKAFEYVGRVFHAVIDPIVATVKWLNEHLPSPTSIFPGKQPAIPTAPAYVGPTLGIPSIRIAPQNQAAIENLERQSRAAGDAANQAISGSKKLIEEYEKAKRALSEFSEENKRAIEAGKAMGLSNEEIAKNIRLVGYSTDTAKAAIDMYVEGLNETTSTANKTGDQIRELTDRIGGQTAIKAWHSWQQALKGTGDLTKLAERDQKELLTVVNDAISTYDRMGREVPADLLLVQRSLAILESKAIATFRQFSVVVPTATGRATEFSEALKGWIRPLEGVEVGINEAGEAISYSAKDVEQLHRNGQHMAAFWARQGPNGLVGLLVAGPEGLDRTKQTVTDTTDVAGKQLDKLARTFEMLANIAGDSFGGIVRDIAVMVGAMNVAYESAGAFKKGLESWKQAKTGEEKFGAAMDLAGNAMGMYAAMQQATSYDSAGKNIAGGALTGASMGFKLGGPWGAAAGAIIGGIWGALKGAPEWKKLSKDISKSWGVQISDDLAKSMEEESKKRGRWAASFLHMGEIIGEAGGLSDANFPTMVGKLREMFSLIELGELSAAEGAKILDDNWQAFVEAGTSSAGVLKKELVDIIRLNREFSQGMLDSAAIQAYMGEQGKKALSGIGGYLVTAADALKRYNTASQDTKRRFELQRELAEATDPEEIAELQKELDEVNKELVNSGNLYQALAIRTQDSATAFGYGLVATFDALRESGMSYVEALSELRPAMDALSQLLAPLGLSGGAGFDLLQAQVALFSDEVAGPALMAVDGLTQGMAALNNMGLMNQDTFSGLAGQIGQTYDTLIAQGKDGAQVMIAMQDPLQRLWELQQEFGYKVDDTTQALIDEAEATGLVGDKHRSETDRMLRASERMVTVLEAIATGLGVTLPAAAEAGARGVQDALDGIRAPDLTIGVDYSIPDVPERMPESMYLGGVVPNYYAQGGKVIAFQPKGSDTVPAMLTPNERVLTVPQAREYDRRNSNDALVARAIDEFTATLRTTLPRQLARQVAAQLTGLRTAS